ncbi:hypothetical protein C427_3216 [Paraglaciecola psychrophila 170]|jgi:hypothetical protein|uniref:Uncharacterized protein n=1 Tax=Paraglaciecola psychrophila 170 TaxID=1129794 RepID=M4RNU0_9ALTE|nr:hypothetical protein C427_3216 [Paraglaciecola psychrophila 170]
MSTVMTVGWIVMIGRGRLSVIKFFDWFIGWAVFHSGGIMVIRVLMYLLQMCWVSRMKV